MPSPPPKSPPPAEPKPRTWSERNGGKSVYTFPGVSNHDLRRVAVEATCDPRCVVKYLRGMNQYDTVKQRIERALIACGLERLVGNPDARLARASNVASLTAAAANVTTPAAPTPSSSSNGAAPKSPATAQRPGLAGATIRRT